MNDDSETVEATSDKPEERPPVDIHKPKAAHSWREFLIEIGTIILGILIALGLEQLVEEIHWKSAVEEARASIHEEMSFNDALFQHRVRVQACVARRLEDIDKILTEAQTSGRLASVPRVNFALSAQISDSQWQAAQAAQTLAHFPHEEISALGRYYDTVDTFKGNFLSKESDAWRWLGDLEGAPHPAASSDLMQLRFALRSARGSNITIPAASKTMLAIAHKMGVKPADRGFDDFEKNCATPGT
jgi:hypothetical protein